jgi:hypothetical protein
MVSVKELMKKYRNQSTEPLDEELPVLIADVFGGCN